MVSRLPRPQPTQSRPTTTLLPALPSFSTTRTSLLFAWQAKHKKKKNALWKTGPTRFSWEPSQVREQQLLPEQTKKTAPASSNSSKGDKRFSLLCCLWRPASRAAVHSLQRPPHPQRSVYPRALHAKRTHGGQHSSAATTDKRARRWGGRRSGEGSDRQTGRQADRQAGRQTDRRRRRRRRREKKREEEEEEEEEDEEKEEDEDEDDEDDDDYDDDDDDDDDVRRRKRHKKVFMTFSTTNDDDE